MADSNIEWCDKTWNPTIGCDKVSAGCHSCYAIRQAYRNALMGHRQYEGLTRKLPDGSVNWTGVVRTLPERLEQPLRWKKPARIFVDSMSDLFHEDVPDEFIVDVFAVMAHANRHTYQILTKRPERMACLVGGSDFSKRVCRRANWNPHVWSWPLRSVWLGTSVEDQRAADERIPLLLQTPAAVRFLSCEPLLGQIELWHWMSDSPEMAEWHLAHYGSSQPISWVIAGGESGPNYRPMDLDWARSLRDQCVAANVSYFFKQIGGRTHAAGGRLLDGRTWDQFPEPVREAASASW